MPEGARIFWVADVYDALTRMRPYKAAWTPEDALAELLGQAGRQFDPAVVRAAMEVLTTPSPVSMLADRTGAADEAGKRAFGTRTLH